MVDIAKSPVSDTRQLPLWEPTPEPSPSSAPTPAVVAILPAPEAIALPDGCRLISYAPLEPPVLLSESETVVDAPKFISVTLRQLDHHLKGEMFLAGNWPLPVLLQRLAACGCIVEIDDQEKGGTR